MACVSKVCDPPGRDTLGAPSPYAFDLSLDTHLDDLQSPAHDHDAVVLPTPEIIPHGRVTGGVGEACGSTVPRNWEFPRNFYPIIAHRSRGTCAARTNPPARGAPLPPADGTTAHPARPTDFVSQFSGRGMRLRRLIRAFVRSRLLPSRGTLHPTRERGRARESERWRQPHPRLLPARLRCRLWPLLSLCVVGLSR